MSECFKDKYLTDQGIEDIRAAVILDVAASEDAQEKAPNPSQFALKYFRKFGEFSKPSSTMLDILFDKLDSDVGVIYRSGNNITTEFYSDALGIQGTIGGDGFNLCGIIETKLSIIDI